MGGRPQIKARSTRRAPQLRRVPFSKLWTILQIICARKNSNPRDSNWLHADEIKGEARTHTHHRSPCLNFTSRLHACLECGHICLMHVCMHAHVRVHHAMSRPQANWLSLFPDPSFVQCRPRSASLGSSICRRRDEGGAQY